MGEERRMGRIAWLWTFFKQLVRMCWVKYRDMGIRGKLIFWGLISFYAALGTSAYIIGADRIAQALYDFTQKISHLRFGWMILIGILVVVSFPPCTGFTTTITLCGFAYGMKGFYVAAAGTLLASAIVLVVLRLLFSQRLRKWASTNEKWQALEAVVKLRGLYLLVLIRASPFPPWAYSNSLFASISTVSLWQFLVATLAVLPRAALHVFIGSRLADLSDGETRRQMDSQTKLINTLLVLLGFVVGFAASWIIYRSMQSHLRHLEGIPSDVDELAAEAVEHAAEGSPLLGNYSSESLDEESIRTVRPLAKPSTVSS